MFCLFPGYERTSGGVVTKYYSFNGVNVAMRTGVGSPVYLYADGVQSTLYTTSFSPPSNGYDPALL
jgi:hypothetical protein